MTLKETSSRSRMFAGRVVAEPRGPAPRQRPTLAALRRAVVARPFYAAAAVLLLVLLSLAILAPVVPMPGPNEQSLVDRMASPMTRDSNGTLHVAGTDQLGRDIFSRVVYGARVSIFVAVAAVVVSGVVGCAVGLVAGYRGGVVDLVLMRMVDMQMAFPGLLLAIFILYLIGASVLNLVLLLSILGWVSYARVVRAQTLSLKAQPFVESAVAVGSPEWRILLRHILPQLTPILATVAVLDFVSVILAEAGLSFLGLGIQPPTSSLGRMVADGQQHLFTGGSWLFLAPGIAIFLIVLATNLTARWAQDFGMRRTGSAQRSHGG